MLKGRFHFNDKACEGLMSVYASLRLSRINSWKGKTLPYTMVIPTLTLDKREGIQASSQERIINNYLHYFSTKSDLVGTRKNRLNETPKANIKLMDKQIFATLRSNF